MSRSAGCVAIVVLAVAAHAQDQRAEWNAPQDPLRIYGNAYYVGPHGLTSLLITSDAGHVLIDGALPESAAVIAANVRRLGFRIEDVRLILNSHAHYDHAGGISELQHRSGARVAALAPSARVLEEGRSGRNDPQYGELPEMARVKNVERINDGETLRVGTIEITAHHTGGHTPGGTSWTWKSCEAGRCLDMVYADSLTPVSADGFLFTRSRDYPAAISDFEKGFSFLSETPCDILVTPHPEAADLWGRLARRDKGEHDALIDRAACRRYADAARDRLRSRIASEQKTPMR